VRIEPFELRARIAECGVLNKCLRNIGDTPSRYGLIIADSDVLPYLPLFPLISKMS
jgi:hypothetical protein